MEGRQYMPWPKGTPRPIEQRIKISNGMKDKIRSVSHRENIRMSLLGRSLTEEHKNNVSLGRRGINTGSNHPLWKGGSQSISNKIRKSDWNKKWRSDVFKRDNWTCQTCSKRGCYLEAHHINELCKLVRQFQIETLKQAYSCSELWDISNGVTLCSECHALTKKGCKT